MPCACATTRLPLALPERARSLSPEKAGQADTALHSVRSAAHAPANKPELRSPADVNDRESDVADALQRLTAKAETDMGTLQRMAVSAHDDSPPAALKPASSNSTPIASAMPPSRAGTLSWQRRPTSSSGRRPLSVIAAENNAARSPRETPDPTTAADQDVSRAQIASALESKDPTWFRQTADRAANSPANRRNSEDPQPDPSSLSGRRHLPGMTPGPSPFETGRGPSPAPESARSTSPSLASSTRESAGWSSRMSTTTAGSGFSPTERRSPLPNLESQKLPPPSEDRAPITDNGEESRLGRVPSLSRPRERMFPERVNRSPSPTKGAGGFVQSAMLKRSDSVNKRWSAQAAPGLSRHSSTASTGSGWLASRDGIAPLTAAASVPRFGSGESRLSRETSLEPSSEANASQSSSAPPQLKPTHSDAGGSDSFVKPDFPLHTRSHSSAAASPIPQATVAPANAMSPPPSPSKRWSPTKATWLESALNKPDSPRLKQQQLPPPQQPSWMTDISKAKQQRNATSVDGSSVPQSAISSPKETVSGTRTPPTDLKNDAQQGTDDQSRKPPSSVRQPNMSPQLKSKPSSPSYETSKEPPPTAALPIKPTQPDSPKTPASEPNVPKSGESSVSKTLKSKSEPAPPQPQKKPITPPKKDFRATLKPRQGPADAPEKQQHEFQNVFGKLKRTQTEKYVAADELKNNILKGKAGLAVTDGPRKTPRRDDLKESLIKQREAIKQKALEGGTSNDTKVSTEVPAKPAVPEALAKRRALGALEAASTPPRPAREPDSSTPEALAKQRLLKAKVTASASEQKAAPASAGTDLPPKPSRLADRFNPALASVIARGPLSGSSQKSSSPAPLSAKNEPKEESAGHPKLPPSSGPLTHMTKERARGPKRRPPKGKEHTSETATAPAQSFAEPPIQPALQKESVPEVLPGRSVDRHLESNQEKETRGPVQLPRVTANEKLPSKPSPKFPEPANAESDGRKIVTERETEHLPLRTTNVAAMWDLKEGSQRSPTKASSELTPAATVKASSAPAVPAEKLHGKPSPKIPEPAHAESSVRKALESERQPLRATGVAATWDSRGTRSPTKASSVFTPNATGKASWTPAIAAEKKSIAPPRTPDTSDRPIRAPVTADTKPASALFGDYFDETPSTAKDLGGVDTQAILTSNPSDVKKVKTLRKHMQEISGDGRMEPVPPHKDHILFEDSMYVCSHVFGAYDGTRVSEVYLWAGLGVSEASVEDAQLFARRVAKEAGGKLIVIRQGKETPNFFQALGGIIITRRGTVSSEARRYMLCGRRHLGHIAFDEVEFALTSFCSGFSYLVCDSGRVFLWKGTGCGAEELGCARLIGMDLGLSGEITELDESHETDAFLSVFASASPPKTIPRSADYWRLKRNHDGYRVRLFRVESPVPPSQGGLQVSSLWPRVMRRPSWQSLTSPTRDTSQTKSRVVEVAPFGQTDLEPEGIYVLDAFFEVYM